MDVFVFFLSHGHGRRHNNTQYTAHRHPVTSPSHRRRQKENHLSVFLPIVRSGHFQNCWATLKLL